MADVDERLLTDSAWVRARRDTWPPGWWKKVSKRALIAGLALAANYFFREVDDRGGVLGSTLIGLVAFLGADLILYPINALLAPRRQRDELREMVRRSQGAVVKSIRAAIVRGSGDIRIIDVTNPGDVTVRDIVVSMPEADFMQPVRWQAGEVAVEEIRPSERASIPFMVTKSMGSSTDPIRVELRGMAEEEEVTTTVVVDPLRL